MPRAQWPLISGHLSIQVNLTLALGGQSVTRNLLADTGAGEMRSRFELLLEEDDCLLCGGTPVRSVLLGGAYQGTFPVYLLRVQIPRLSFDQNVLMAGIPNCPKHFEGIAGFRFLNRFTYGNFGDRSDFGLEI